MDVEWLILADAAQVVDGKLYLLGGGWTTITVSGGFPAQQRIALALAIGVPWDETNRRHGLEIEITDEDGRSLARVEGQFEVGRPPGIPLGQSQRLQFAADITMGFDKPGTFVIVVRINGVEGRRIEFNVTAGAART